MEVAGEPRLVSGKRSREGDTGPRPSNAQTAGMAPSDGVMGGWDSRTSQPEGELAVERAAHDATGKGTWGTVPQGIEPQCSWWSRSAASRAFRQQQRGTLTNQRPVVVQLVPTTRLSGRIEIRGEALVHCPRGCTGTPWRAPNAIPRRRRIAALVPLIDQTLIKQLIKTICAWRSSTRRTRAPAIQEGVRQHHDDDRDGTPW